MHAPEEIDERAKAFRQRAEMALQRLGITGEYYCPEQRERWLKRLEDVYANAAKGRRLPRLYEIQRSARKGSN